MTPTRIGAVGVFVFSETTPLAARPEAFLFGVELMTFYCPNCWNKMAAEERECGRCGADLSCWDEKTFADKLVGALSHPEPQTQMRAVAILGETRAVAAVAALIQLYRSGADPFLQAAIVKALAQIGGETASSLLTDALENSSFIVRRQAADALTEAEKRKALPAKRGQTKRGSGGEVQNNGQRASAAAEKSPRENEP
jgi:HEAT repeat protein